MNFINLTVWDVAAVSVFVLLNGLLSLWLSLGIERQLLVATVRMVVQLSAVGAVLTLLFGVASLPWTLLMALVMVLFAGREIVARQKRRLSGWWGYGLGTATMTLAAATLTLVALLGSLQPEPWYDPRYAIPLFGMILGNAMTGISLGLDTLTTATVRERAAIEARIALGAARFDALRPVMQEAMRRGFMPMINSMAAAGVVSLPGMMTGQILAGIAPAEAVRYQLLIMFLIAGATGLGLLTAVLGGALRLTDHRHRLRPDRLTEPR
jgi:putative ABC transport system permease protein